MKTLRQTDSTLRAATACTPHLIPKSAHQLLTLQSSPSYYTTTLPNTIFVRVYSARGLRGTIVMGGVIRRLGTRHTHSHRLEFPLSTRFSWRQNFAFYHSRTSSPPPYTHTHIESERRDSLFGIHSDLSSEPLASPPNTS